jgi:hypothetical protein
MSEFVAWQHPAGTSRVEYSAAVFHEIEFLVSDGFRRIPHGGIETGGLLFGTVDNNLTRIAALRQIECEHAFGPSFQLSDRDIQKLEEQLAHFGADEELKDLVPVGWFVAHTRSELILNEREVQLFGRLFPQTGRVTVLVRPEKFKQTRFAILVRGTDGRIPTDGREMSFPLSPGSSAPRRLIPIVEEAPADRPVSSRATENDGRLEIGEQNLPDEAQGGQEEDATVQLPPVPLPEQVAVGIPALEIPAAAAVPELQISPVDTQPEPISVKNDQTTRDETTKSVVVEDSDTVRESSRPPEADPTTRVTAVTSTGPPADADATSPKAVPTTSLPDPTTAPADRTAKLAPSDPTSQTELPTLPRIARRHTWEEETPLARISLSTWTMLGASVVFAVMALYGMFLHFSAAVIPVGVAPNGDLLVVSWPVEETKDVADAEIRINNGAAHQLSVEEKDSGTYSLRSGGGDVMVDLVVRHRFRTARGITRYIVSAPGLRP